MTLNYSITSSDAYYVIIDNPNWIPDILPPSIDIISYQAVQNYPNSYYLTVKTDPHDIVSIPGENWYLRGYYKILTAPFAVTVNSSFQYRFQYWDVDGVSYGIDANTITVEMNSNHTATAHYVPRRLIEHDGSFAVRFSTRDPHWSTPHTLNGSINGYSLMTGQMLFVSWSIVVQPMGNTPYIYLLDSYQVQVWYWSNFLHQGVASRGYLKLVESWQGTIDYQIAYLYSIRNCEGYCQLSSSGRVFGSNKGIHNNKAPNTLFSLNARARERAVRLIHNSFFKFINFKLNACLYV